MILRLGMLVIVLLGRLLLTEALGADAQETCDSLYKGVTVTPMLLAIEREYHRRWHNKEPSGQPADLCSADLSRANLQKADLVGANLQKADLQEANLQEADLQEARLAGANLQKALLAGANLQKADLSRANLQKADLVGANLQQADLTGANLQGANLTDANLQGANLTDANLQGANLTDANLQPAELTGANLQRTNLTDANLQQADLRWANLQGANLYGANLQEADLGRANLQGANLGKANLQATYLFSANLQAAILVIANLQGATLVIANLQGADLRWANLQAVDLLGANLQEATFTKANLSEALYAPSSVPAKGYLGGIEGLSSVWFSRGDLSGLVLLRAALKDVGLRTLEREATYALQHTERCYNWPAFCPPQLQNDPHLANKAPSGFFATLDGLFHFFFFELTCAYGLKPGRPLLVLLGFIPVFAIVYLVALHTRRDAGIWAVWQTDRVHKHPDEEIPRRLTYEEPFPKPRTPEGAETGHAATSRCTELCTKATTGQCTLCDALAERDRFLQWPSAIRLALYFSLLSAFHLGWRELNVGTWITRLQPREYTLRATGWVRVVSGLQSLLSVYLLALWALTYFGRPFE